MYYQCIMNYCHPVVVVVVVVVVAELPQAPEDDPQKR